MNILLLQFKNYFDRKIKKFDTISEYYSYQIGNTFSNINFIPGDGVTTELILNFDTATLGSPDYLLAAESDTVFTRWFVMESERTRKGQTRFKLRRDLIAEEIEDIKGATSMVKKGYCEWGNPAFFNKEPITVNSISHGREFLIDQSASGWLVAYVPKHKDTESTWEDTEVKFGTNKTEGQYEFASLSEAKKAMGNNQAYISGTIETYFGSSVARDELELTKYTFFLQNGSYFGADTVSATDNHSRFYGNSKQWQAAATAGVKAIYSTLGARMTPSTYTHKGYSSVTSTVAKYNGCTFKDTSTGLVYKATVTINSMSVSDTYVAQNNLSDVYSIFLKAAQGVDSTVGCYGPNALNIYQAQIRTTGATCYYVTVTYKQVSDSIYTWKISKTRRQTADAPYDCICMPYRTDGLTASFKIDGVSKTVDYNANMQLASNLSAYWGSSVYDVQLLPYCPVQDLINPTTADGTTVTSATSGTNYTYDETSKTVVFYCNTINIKFTRPYTVSIANTKENLICRNYKLVAPNFSKEYELPVIENDGINYFEITQTLIPYSPWVQVVPKFKNYNGVNLNDSKGLIVGGSLSITQTNSSWAEYLRTNSNYSQIFDSQMAYQEYQQKNSLISAGLGAASGALTTGIGTGIMTADPILGAAAGAVSGVAGIADVITQAGMNKKTNEYTREQRSLQLGNIKNTPATISKVTSINSNFAVWPYIETSQATDKEFTIVEDYLKNYGMTINQVGKLGDFMNNDYYCSADIIVAEDILGDANYKNQIKSEVSQGFFYEED